MAKAVPVKINWSEHRQKFADLLNKFSAYGYSRFNVFSDFCELSAISIADNCDPYHLVNSEKTVDEREERYKNLIGKYKPEAQNLFGDILAAIVQEMQTYCPNHFIDVLGEIYHSLEFQDKWRGQFFTPQSVCDTMGRMAMLDGTTVKERIAEKGYVSLNEPCCGGGAIILGAANALTYHGLNPQKQMLTVATDLDARCVHMCYIQLSLYGLPAIVLQQDSLTFETFGSAWFTPIFICDGWTIKARHLFRDNTPPAKEPPPMTTQDTKL